MKLILREKEGKQGKSDRLRALVMEGQLSCRSDRKSEERQLGRGDERLRTAQYTLFAHSSVEPTSPAFFGPPQSPSLEYKAPRSKPSQSIPNQAQPWRQDHANVQILKQARRESSTLSIDGELKHC